ncbi:uncharacterized protein LOC100375153 [Saccoglossus kowalevskii]|uniref:Regeneration associated protein-like 279 n=1 Tax=Saccoglossus kowalevskii TaxID=10224 RepID=A0A0U2UDG2_SACKO|nr:PREDICTED: uncharacterized protein LOC100375153 [Saccoglossus kowalevskii]ALR88640.1 regeneration associated protein-like 279 [Saccoglossus kowalevskii]
MATKVFIISAVVVAMSIAIVNACSSSSGRTPAWDVGDNAEVYPTYDPATESVGVGVTIRFKRGAAAMPRNAVPDPEQVFNKLNMDKNSFIEVQEWKRQKGSISNFAEMLEAIDIDGDERISLDEFKLLKLYYKTTQGQ